MRILLLTQLFQPEPNLLKGLAFAKELVRRGHEVQVLTGYPNYPSGKMYPGYSRKIVMSEVVEGISVIRVPHFVDHSSSVFNRVLSYLSFAITAVLPGMIAIKRPDVIHVYQGPATLVFPALIMKLIWRVPYVLDVQDLWPESVSASGMLSSRTIFRLIDFWCDICYRNASRIVVLSGGYKNKIIARGIDEGVVEVVYNWCDPAQERSNPNLVKITEILSEEKFNLVYAGNFGAVQGLDCIISAMDMLKDKYPSLSLVLVGDGVEEKKLLDLVKNNNVFNVEFRRRLPVECIGSVLESADALIIHLVDQPLSSIGIPQKTQAYLSAGKPILMAVRGDAAKLVEEASAGVICEPGNSGSIAAGIEKMLNMHQDHLKQMGLNGKKFYWERLSFDTGVRKMEVIFDGVVK